MRVGWYVWLSWLLTACGGAEPQAARSPQVSSGTETPAPQEKREMAVQGLMGKLPDRVIERTMHGRLRKMQRCFFEGMGEVELLGGHIKFYLRVGPDGRVEYAVPRGSSIGHRATELCLLDVAHKTRFPKPHGGGPAEFAWGFELENPGGVRPPVAWDSQRVAESVERQRDGLQGCPIAGQRFVITAYVAQGGQIMAAGAASDSEQSAAQIDCVLDVIRGWSMPDPGSYPAKVSFELSG